MYFLCIDVHFVMQEGVRYSYVSYQFVRLLGQFLVKKA